MLNCDAIKLDLSAYHDGALPPEERAAVESHLSECAACKAELSEIERARAALVSLPRIKAPSGLNAKIKAQISHETNRPKESPRMQPHASAPRRAGYSWLATTSGIAATMVLGVLCYFLYVTSVSEQISKTPSLAKHEEPIREHPAALKPYASDKL